MGVFELVKLIRDREIMRVIDLLPYVRDSEEADTVTIALEGLRDIGWIEIDGDQLRTTDRFKEVQKTLGISLTQLAPLRRHSMIVNPVFGAASHSPTPAEVFVVMPFAPDLNPIYEHHLKPVASRLDVSIARADDFFATNAVISDVWNAVANAKVLIADCTGRNPNVFYELGIAHTIGKPVVLISQSKNDISFDVQHMRAIIYEFTPRGMEEFEYALEKTLRRELNIAPSEQL